MFLIPNTLSAIALYMLFQNDQKIFMGVIISILFISWLVNEAVRNSYVMETTGESNREITDFWTIGSIICLILKTTASIYVISVS
jgi:hypothetical protein